MSRCGASLVPRSHQQRETLAGGREGGRVGWWWVGGGQVDSHRAKKLKLCSNKQNEQTDKVID